MFKIDNQRIGYPHNPCTGGFFTDAVMDQVVSGAYRLLEEVGIRLTNPDLVFKLKKAGFKEKDGRLCIQPETSRDYLEATVERHSAIPTSVPAAETSFTFDGLVNPYPYQYIDPESEEILPFDTLSLTRMTQFVENFSQLQGFTPSVAGYPKDVPVELESLVRYKIWIENCHRGWSAEPTSRLSAKYLFEMTAVMGQSIESLPVYMATPLTLGDESLYTVLEHTSRLKSAFVASMPSFGASTPLSVSASFSLILAEVLGGAILVHHLTGLPVDILPQVLPFDFHDLNIVFGSPEALLFEWLSCEFNARLFKQAVRIGATNIHTWAKKPGIQSAVEKSSLIMAGALNGSRYFAGLGALSLDEIFSPVQLVLDIEMLDQAARTVKGIAVDPLPEDLTEMVREGIRQGFVASDLTLDHHQEYIRYSPLFEHSNLQTWLGREPREALKTARETVRRLMDQPVAYSLEPEKKRAIDEIYHRALKEVGHHV